MESKEVNITYETLFELLKREKDKADLQKLDPSFFNDFVTYLNEKKEILLKDDNLFSHEEKKKTEMQIDNAKRLIREIYERREKKILNIALMKSRTKSNIVDTSTLLGDEKKFLEEIENVLNSYRSDIIDKILDEKRNSIPNDKKDENTQNKSYDKKETKLVRFLHSVPKFIGKELEDYGPFDNGDIANLPIEIADLLLTKKEVEEIKGG